MHHYLKKIIENKRREVAVLKQSIVDGSHSLTAKIFATRQSPRPLKSLYNALSQPGLNVIAEIKRRSPSKPYLAEIKHPVELAKHYVAGGASAISVLTDATGFGGSLQDLQNVANALQTTPVPILRKDFIVDEIQIAQAIAFGADAILLIVGVLQEKTTALLNVAHQFGVDVLVEVHNPQELEIALQANAQIIGVNNRDLTTFEVNLNNVAELKKFIPNGIVAVAESGVDSVARAHDYAALGYQAILVGEALVKTQNPTQLIREMRQS